MRCTVYIMCSHYGANRIEVKGNSQPLSDRTGQSCPFTVLGVCWRKIYESYCARCDYNHKTFMVNSVFIAMKTFCRRECACMFAQNTKGTLIIGFYRAPLSAAIICGGFRARPGAFGALLCVVGLCWWEGSVCVYIIYLRGAEKRDS